MESLLIVLSVLGLLTLIAVIIVNLRVRSYSTERIFSSQNVPADGRVAIVLGARVEDDGTPSNTLNDRVLTGVELYKTGKAPKLLLSGGNTEPATMRKLALELGVPESDLIVDDLGTRTYESCVRAKTVFGIDRAIVVTQDYHLARSLYLCENLGIDAVGVDAKRREYLGERYAWVREYLSRVKAWKDINLWASSSGSEE